MKHFFLPILFLSIISGISIGVSYFPWFLGIISPLLIALLLGILLGNTLFSFFPQHWNIPIRFGAKKLLRWGIILYGFKISIIDIAGIGIEGFLLALGMVFSTFGLIFFIHKKWGNPKDDSIMFLVGAGASVCGATAVLAMQSTIKARTEHATVAITTVVVFGTLSLLSIPLLYWTNFLPFPDTSLGMFIGATVHEVAQVVAVGNFFSSDIAEEAVIVKMTRVILLAVLLLSVSLYIQKPIRQSSSNSSFSFRSLIDSVLTAIQSIPFFVFAFLGVIGINTVFSLPSVIHSGIVWIDTFFLTFAMLCLGIQTQLSSFKNIGGYAFWLGGIAFIWLTIGGSIFTWLLSSVF